MLLENNIFYFLRIVFVDFFIFSANGFQFLFRSCRDNELRYLLTFVQTTLTSLTYGEKENVFICFLVLASFEFACAKAYFLFVISLVKYS